MNAPATRLTSGQRIAAMRDRLSALTKRMPPGWENWSVDQVRRYKGYLLDLERARSVPKVQAAATQIGAYYGVRLPQLDPGAEVSA